MVIAHLGDAAPSISGASRDIARADLSGGRLHLSRRLSKMTFGVNFQIDLLVLMLVHCFLV